MQSIYDYVFKQLEVTIREIGYGDASINKQMKMYINLFHSLIIKIESWDSLNQENKNNFFCYYLNKSMNMENLIQYFDNYYTFLKNNTFNSFSKGVIKINF